MNLLSRCFGSPLNRRNFLHVGAIGALGLTLDQYMRLQAAEPAAKKKPKAEACIHIFLPGGRPTRRAGIRSRSPRSSTAGRWAP